MSRAVTRWLVQDCFELCISEMARQGLFRGSPRRRAYLSWGSAHPIDISDPIEAEVQLDRFLPRLHLTYTIQEQGNSFTEGQEIGLDRVSSGFGGWRWWFFCPRCGAHRGKLYLPPDASKFACRRCHELLYLTQRLTAAGRAGLRVNRLAEKLGGDGEREPCWTRSPRGMRRRTFQRLHAAYLAAVQVDEEWIRHRLARFEAQFRSRIPANTSSQSMRD